MKPKTLGFLFILVGAVAFFYTTRSTMRNASLLLVNGTIYTMDEANTVAQAVAVRGDRIVAAGTTDDLKLSFHADSIVDLNGRTVVPGLVDGHGHVLNEGSRLSNLDVAGTTSQEQIAAMVAKRLQELRSAGETGRESHQWVIGRGWDQNKWAVKEFPEHEILDNVAPNNPVLLRRVDGHAMWVNKKTMDLAGITASTKDPEGGRVYRDAKGNPTGVFVDNAMDLITTAVPELTEDEVAQRLKLALDECAQLGLTEVHDMGVDLQVIRAYKRLIDNHSCPIRVYAAISDTGETWNFYRTQGKEVDYGGRLTVRSMKLFMDGALGSRGAALLDAYSDDPGNRGLTVMAEPDVERLCSQALASGFQVCTHAIGDRANHIVLDVYEKTLKSLPLGSPSPRWRIEHAQVIQPSDMQRFAQLSVVPSMQPTHATSDMYWAETRLGAERVRGAYAWRTLIQSGCMIVGGSDFPVEGVNPLWGFYAACTRSDKDGYPQNGWHPEQKMTREEALRAFTIWAAYGAFQENVKGTIESGKWADLTVLSKDIMTVPAEEILSADVEMTLVGGKIVYQKPSTTVAQ